MLELLEDPAYRHMLTNHIPIIGLATAFIVLTTGVLLRHTALLFLGLVLVALTAGSSLPVEEFGDDAYPAVFDKLDADGRAWLDYHVELADSWIILLYINTALAVIALVIGLLRRRFLLLASIIVMFMTLAGVGSATFIAKAGGKIKHPEFRLDDPPQVEPERRL